MLFILVLRRILTYYRWVVTARARPCIRIPVFLGSLARKTGRCAPSASPIAALLIPPPYMYTMPKIRNKYSQERNCAATIQIIHIHVSESDLYTCSCDRSAFLYRKIGGPTVGIYRSLLDTCGNWD
jgi:hypothetical protein